MVSRLPGEAAVLDTGGALLSSVFVVVFAGPEFPSLPGEALNMEVRVFCCDDFTGLEALPWLDGRALNIEVRVF